MGPIRMMGGCQPDLAAPHRDAPLQNARGSCESVVPLEGGASLAPCFKNGLRCLSRPLAAALFRVSDDTQALTRRRMPGDPSWACRGNSTQCIGLRWFGWT